MEKNKLSSEKISKLLLSLAIPSIIAQLVNVLYNMVDRIYIGQMPDGTTAMASLSVVLPILTLVTAFTRLVGEGGAPLCAIRMGEQKQDKAEEIMTASFVSLIGMGFLLTVIILIFKESLLIESKFESIIKFLILIRLFDNVVSEFPSSLHFFKYLFNKFF